MSYKGLAFAAAASLAVTSVLTAASAAPFSWNPALQGSDGSVAKVDYYYPGHRYRAGSYNWDGAAVPSYSGYRYRPAEPGYEADPAWNREYGDVPAPRTYGGPGLAAIPGAVIGGAAGAIAGAFNGAARGAARGSAYFSRPYYGARSYGGAYYGGEGWGDLREGLQDDGAAACERDFASFDRTTGTYIDGYGSELMCPYLERWARSSSGGVD